MLQSSFKSFLLQSKAFWKHCFWFLYLQVVSTEKETLRKWKAVSLNVPAGFKRPGCFHTRRAVSQAFAEGRSCRVEWVCPPTAVRGLGASETFQREPSLSSSHYHEWGVRTLALGPAVECWVGARQTAPPGWVPPGSLPAPSCMFSRVPNLDGQEDPGQQVAVSWARTARFQQLWQTVKSLGSWTWCLTVSSSEKYDRHSFWCLYWSAMATAGPAERKGGGLAQFPLLTAHSEMNRSQVWEKPKTFIATIKPKETHKRHSANTPSHYHYFNTSWPANFLILKCK